MINILFISLRGDFGGGTKHLDSILDNLSGYNKFCAAPLEAPYGTKWKDLIGVNKFFGLEHRKFSLVTFVKLLFFVKRHKIKIIHSHGKGAGVYSRLLRIFIWSLRIVHTFHGIHLDKYNTDIKKYIYILYENIFSHLTDIFINVSKGEQQLCIDKHIVSNNNSVVIYNGIDDQYNNLQLDKIELRNNLSLPQNKFVIVTATRFDYQKYMEASLELAHKLKDYPDILFVWIGDGDDRKKIEDEARSLCLENICFMGYRKEVLQILSASDIYLTTSRWEGLPYSLIEAAKVGLPIIASNVVGNNEVVIYGKNGFLFDLKNLDNAKDHIMAIYSNENLRKQLSACSRKIFEEEFKLNRMITRLLDTYKILI